MARGPKKHLKRLAAPKHWMLDKLGGTFAPRPSAGPHKLRECLPLVLILRNRLKYALTRKEVQTILMKRLVRVDGKVRTDMNFPVGLMDVISIAKTNENFRLVYDVKGRFTLKPIDAKAAAVKLCRVTKISTANKASIGVNPFAKQGTREQSIPYATTHDGRTIRYPHPAAKTGDSVEVEIATGKITKVFKLALGNVVMVTKGANVGRVGVLSAREKHPGSDTIVRIKDRRGAVFATRETNCMIIGSGAEPATQLPKANGVAISIIEEAKKKKATA